MAMTFKRNDYVRRGQHGTRVYRINKISERHGEPVYWLEPDAEHPDAAKRVQNAFDNWHPAADLTLVSTARQRSSWARQ